MVTALIAIEIRHRQQQLLYRLGVTFGAASAILAVFCVEISVQSEIIGYDEQTVWREGRGDGMRREMG